MRDHSAHLLTDSDEEDDPVVAGDDLPEGGCGEHTAPGDPRSTKRSAKKCPYLAGRQHLGTYHTAPSRENRCYARPAADKPHAWVSRDRQELLCLRSAEIHEQCRDYQCARRQGISPPEFGSRFSCHETPKVENLIGPRYRRVRHRRRHPPLARWWKRSRREFLISLAFLLSFFLLIIGSAYILPPLLGVGNTP
jgi:hypothetical protein